MGVSASISSRRAANWPCMCRSRSLCVGNCARCRLRNTFCIQREHHDLEPLPDLKKRIEEWLAVKRAERRAARGG